jgi:CBS domain containing-hemolysin-like protein
MTEISNYITNDYQPIKNFESIAEVQDFFEESNFSHFPVMEDDIYIGSVSKNDLESFDLDKKISDYGYSLEGFFARNNMIWLDVMEVFAKNHTNLVPVLDPENKYLGYYEMEDVMTIFRETPFLKESGGIIIIKKSISDYSMSQITQIVESNNGKLLGLFVSDSDFEFVQITLKIRLNEVNEIIQSFRRYNYEIVSEHQEDEYISVLKERSEYLEKYLKI